jgi:GNAT superfamily N-acetyltransferase
MALVQGEATLRTELRPGDMGEVVRMHGVLYAREHGFDATFEAYVAEPLARFVIARSPRERMWIAERGSRMVGCVAIVAASRDVAQLRWFLVDPAARGRGIGGRLLDEAIAFSRERGYRSIVLWTVSALAAAARLYLSRGFALAERKPGRMWGTDVVEERYERSLG